MLSVMLVIALSTAPRLAAPGLQCAEMSAASCNAFADHLNQQLTVRGVQVVTSSDIETVLGIERQKQLLGCAENQSSCIAEIAGALGVDGVLRGSVAKLGATTLVNLRIVSAKDAQRVGSFSESVASLDLVPEALERGAAQLALSLGITAQPKIASKTRLRTWALVPAGLAVASGIGGGVALAVASGASSELRNKLTLEPGYDPSAVQQRGQSAAIAGYVLLGVAGASAVTAGVMFLLGKPAPAGELGLALSPGGATLTLTGTLP